MTWVAVGVGVAGIAANYMGQQQAGSAASNAAGAQQGAASKWQYQQDLKNQQAMGILQNAVTPAQMASHNDALAAQERTVQRQESLAQSLSPALIDSGKQLKQLLNGQSAPALSNISNQRANQRQQLVDQLNSQMGPGGSSSSAGQQQLAKFDSDTANTMSNAQQSYIQQLSGMSLSGMSQITGASNQANEGLSNIGNADPMAQNAKDRANLLAGQAVQSGPQSAILNAAGGQFAGAGIQGRANANLGSSLLQGAAAYAGKNQSTPTAPGAPLTLGSSVQQPNNSSYNASANQGWMTS